MTELQLTALTAAARAGGGEPVDGTTIARRMGRTSRERIGSTLQALVAEQALALEPGGYRVVSRPLARLLQDDGG